MTRTRHCTSPAAAFGWPSSTLPRGRAEWACSGWAARTSFGRKSRGPELTAGDGNGNWSSAFLPCCPPTKSPLPLRAPHAPRGRPPHIASPNRHVCPHLTPLLQSAEHHERAFNSHSADGGMTVRQPCRPGTVCTGCRLHTQRRRPPSDLPT